MEILKKHKGDGRIMTPVEMRTNEAARHTQIRKWAADHKLATKPATFPENRRKQRSN